MKWLERLVMALGLLVLLWLIWKLDARAVWTHISVIGWGFLLIFGQQIFDHVINAWGWKFSFSPTDAQTVVFSRLVTARIIGDGVNYLTPSATIAGEMVRPALVQGDLPWERKVASVVVARFTQSLGQAFFIMLGLAFMVFHARHEPATPIMEFIRRWFFVPMSVLAALCAAIAVYAVITWHRKRSGGAEPGPLPSSWGRIKSDIRDYFLGYPGRFILSVLFFTAGYLWGAVETYLICYYMGLSPSVTLAVSIEVLSSVIDGLFFMVPAKIGTQEAGKTAIFTSLGLPAAQGFALGLVRHVREVAWAGLGLALYAAVKRGEPKSLSAQGSSSSVHA